MVLNTTNIKDTHCIPKKYLKDKKFSYKLYVYLCSNIYWESLKENDISRDEYYLKYIEIGKLVLSSRVSNGYFSKQMKYAVYRMKITDDGFKHLYFYSPTSNFTKITREDTLKLIGLDEIAIRAYIYLASFSSNTIYGQDYKKILESCGYSSNSNSTKDKLSNGIEKLVELNLISRKLHSNGLKTYYIYYKK